MFRRSTKSVVQGNALENAMRRTPQEPVKEPEAAPVQAKKRRLLPALSLTAAMILLLLFVGMVLLQARDRGSGGLELNGQALLAVPAEASLCQQAAQGDVLRIYSGGEEIPSLRYVEVQSAGADSLTVLVTDRQLSDYMAAGGDILPVLVIHQDREAAAEALTLQKAWNDPEVTITMPEYLELSPGETAPLEAAILAEPEGAVLPAAEYESSDPDILTVEDGVLTAQGTGEATITVTCGSESVQCRVAVLLFAEELEFESDEITIGVGGNAALTPSVSPTDSTEPLEWSSSDESVARVDSSGSVTGLREGEAVITAAGRNASASYTVRVQTEATGISLSREKMSLEVGGMGALAAAVTPEDASDKTVSWDTSDKKVAAVDSEGTVTAIGEGTAVITASCGAVSAECSVTVTPPAAEIGG